MGGTIAARLARFKRSLSIAIEKNFEGNYGSPRFSAVPSRSSIAALLPIAGIFWLGCSIDLQPPGGASVSQLDLNYFACNVQRPLIRRCSMLACHGSQTVGSDGTVYEHALRIYSPGKLRLVPASTMNDRDQQLTLDELDANFASAQGLTFAAATPDDVPLLRKPLSPTAGGGEHTGGALFVDQSDADYLSISNWVTGSTQPDGCQLLTEIQSGIM
jgi:hypothetical protein